MILEIALAAAMLQHDYGACAAIPADWQINECVEVPGPRIAFGEVTMGKVVVQNTGFTTPEEPTGNIGVDMFPAPTHGYYQYGVWPVCEREGAVTSAGTGGPGYQPSGTVDNPDPHYRTIKNTDFGYSVLFNEDPCVSPARRGLAVVGGYSNSEVVGLNQEGWVDGDQTTGAFSAVITIPANWNTKDTIALSVFQHSCEGPISGSYTAAPCYIADLKDWTVSVQFFQTGSGVTNTSTWSGAGYTNSGFTAWVPSKPASYVPSVGLDRVQITYRLNGVLQDTDTWYPVGSASRPDQATGYTGQAMVVFPSGLDRIVYDPNPPEFEWLDGQCDSMDCVSSYCDGYGIDVVGWLGCFFGFDVSPLDWFESLWDNIQHGEFWDSATYILEMVKSYPTALAGLDGDCGMLFNVTSGPLAGLEGDTCSWPMPGTVRGIAAAFVYLAAGLAVLRLTTKLMIEGHPGYFGFGTRGESQGTLW